MARGRKPEAAEVKRAKGNPGKRRIAETPAELPDSPKAAPRHLSRAARTVWQAGAPDLMRLKFLRRTDVAAFARYCEHLAHWWELTRRLRRKGVTYKTKSRHGEMLRLNPDFNVRERIESRLESLEDRFGLTPRARQELLQKLAQQPPADLPLGAGGEDQPGDDDQDRPSPIGMLGSHALH